MATPPRARRGDVPAKRLITVCRKGDGNYRKGLARRIDSDRKLNPRSKRDSSIINILHRQGKAMG